MTRGALNKRFRSLTTWPSTLPSFPRCSRGTLPWLKSFDVMNLHSPTSAILSAVIFNAIIIPLLIPIALKGVEYRPVGADALLRRNRLIWAGRRDHAVRRHQTARCRPGRLARHRLVTPSHSRKQFTDSKVT